MLQNADRNGVRVLRVLDAAERPAPDARPVRLGAPTRPVAAVRTRLLLRAPASDERDARAPGAVRRDEPGLPEPSRDPLRPEQRAAGAQEVAAFAHMSAARLTQLEHLALEFAADAEQTLGSRRRRSRRVAPAARLAHAAGENVV